MSKGNTFENDFLLLIFHGTTIANIANNASASPLTQDISATDIMLRDWGVFR